MPHKIAIVVATPLTITAFLSDQIKSLNELYSVSLITGKDKIENLEILPDNVTIYIAPIRREISLFHDLSALVYLIRIFRRNRFSMVHSVTPKAGLLSMVAARLASVPHRLHVFTGQVWATRHGMARFLLKSLDKVTARCATMVLTDSATQRDFLIQQGVLSMGSCRVLADGSISGVDLVRFRVDSVAGHHIRQELNIRKSAIVVLFLGRLKRDKGVLDLSEAFLHVFKENPRAVLVFVGSDEEELLPEMRNILKSCLEAVRFVPFSKTPENYMMAADIFCLPSYREGFGSVIIEAAACGVPSVASRIYGLTDAVVENETGYLVPPGNVGTLAEAIGRLADDEAGRRRLGEAARARAVQLFSQERLTQALLDLYREFLGGQSVVPNSCPDSGWV
jgi:glycosyltransferase involved in cell wall biosynthesis